MGMHSPKSTRQTDRHAFFERDGVRVTRLDYDSRFVQSVHEHEFSSVTLVMSGACHELSEFDDHVSQACTVLIKPAHRPHANYYGAAPMVSLQIAFKPEVFANHTFGEHCAHLDGGASAAAMIALLRAAITLPADALAPQIANAVATVSAALAERGGHTIPAWLGELTARLTVDPAARVSVQSLARDAGLHPVSLARIFRRHHGCSITEFVRRTRIVRASHRIAAGDASLADIAADIGFADQPHLTRVFRAELGCTPGEFRKMVV